MKKDLLRFILSTLVCTIVLAGCGGNVPATSTTASASLISPTSPAVTQEPGSQDGSTTPDPCLSPQIEETAQKVHSYMREFDDVSNLAAALPQAQLSDSISELQRIRREADDEPVPACLTALKNYEVQHMNAAIGTFLAVLRLKSAEPIDCLNAGNSPEQQAFCQNFALATQYHDQYLLELARVLGITMVPATPGAATTPAETPTP